MTRIWLLLTLIALMIGLILAIVNRPMQVEGREAGIRWAGR
jgi:hypothetical protein